MTKTPLSGRELQCLEWVSLGKTSWETASILGLSERTVNFHLRNACRKLNVYGRQAGVVKAVRLGLLHTGNQESSENTSTQTDYSLISEPVTA